MAKTKSTNNGLPVSPLVKTLSAFTTKQKGLRLMTGLPGKAEKSGFSRLYFDMELRTFADIPNNAIAHSCKVPLSPDYIGAMHIWVDEKATVLKGGVAALIKDITTMATSEETDGPTTMATGEEGEGPSTMITGEEGGGPTTMATSEETISLASIMPAIHNPFGSYSW
jgi:hypothetical protein